MKFVYIFAIASITPAFLNGMLPLNVIEKSLVLREINLRGIAYVEQCLKNQSELSISRSNSAPILPVAQQTPQPSVRKSSSDNHIPRIIIPILLTIKDTFFRIDRAEIRPDIVSEAIFKKIDQMESQNGYCPKTIETFDGQYCYYKQATNILGHYTRYYWEDENSKDTVSITCNITNKKELEEIVKQERMRLKQAINKQ